MRESADTLELLRVLIRHGVEFIVVGMTAGVLQGAPVVTFDLDIVYRREPDNLDRLLAALLELDARFRGNPRRIPPNLSHLESAGHKLFETRLGDCDVLGSIDDGLGFDDLMPDTINIETEELSLHVLGLKRLIEIKRRAGRPKDLAALPVLQSTLERSGS